MLGDGKTHYIEKQLASAPQCLKIAVNEAFTPLSAIKKLCALPTDVPHCAIYFNFTMLPPGVNRGRDGGTEGGMEGERGRRDGGREGGREGEEGWRERGGGGMEGGGREGGREGEEGGREGGEEGGARGKIHYFFVSL